MSRQLSIEYPGALFHISCRGNARQSIFLDDVDREEFLSLLGRCVRRFDWILAAYVLMGNHFHLVYERHERVGHLLQGRPDARLVEKETYYLEVLRYDVLNPVRAGLVTTPEEYRWSSHRAVLGEVEAPDWLAVDDVLAQFGSDRDTARARYRCFVDAGIGLERTPWSDLAGQIYLGSDAWIETVRERITLKPRCEEHPRCQRLPATTTMSDIISAVSGTLNVDQDCVRLERGLPRRVAAWLGWNEALLTGPEIAAGLRLSYGRVSQLVSDCDRELRDDAHIRDAVSTIVRKLKIKDLTPPTTSS